MTEWNAAGYSSVAALQSAMAEEVLALLHLHGTERVLDLGCGNGKITAEIAARLPQGSILGIDASSDMIAFAREHFPASNAQFTTGDIRQVGFREEFDLIVSFNALHWIPDQDNALRSIRSAMKPDGMAQLRLVPRGERKSLENVLEETRLSAAWSSYFQEFRDPYLHLTPEQYAAAAERNGLLVRRLQVHDKAWDFKSREAFQAFGSVTFVEWTKLLPEDQKPAFVRDVLNRYKNEVCTHPGEENVFKFYQMDIVLSPL
jgi:trans-aconitate 2-methyltransferase